MVRDAAVVRPHAVLVLHGHAGDLCAEARRFRRRLGRAPNFYETALAAAKAANIDLNPPFSLLATLLVAPIAWTSLQWATYSAQQNGEIKGARSFQNQLVIIIGSLIATGVLLAILAAAFEHAIGTDFLYVAGAGYWAGLEEGKFNGVFLWPNIVANALAGNPIIVVIIASGTSSTRSRSSTTAISA